MSFDAPIQTWYSAAQLAGKPGMPGTERAVQLKAEKAGWAWRKREGRGGGREYSIDALPAETHAALLLSSPISSTLPATAGASSATPANPGAAASYDRDTLQLHYDRVPQKMKDEAARKQRACLAVAALVDKGQRLGASLDAVELATAIPAASIKRWWYSVAQSPRADWLALLVDGYQGRVAKAECDPQAWDWFKGQYLSRREPSYADSYRRLEKVATQHKWAIPSQKTLERRMETEVSPYTRTLMRKGPEAMARMFPSQSRDRSVFAAGQAVNGDGLKFDTLWVVFEDGEIINTATGWFWQDIGTNKIIAHRVNKTENTDLFRLSTWDLTAVCLPEHVWVDNTRVAANKAMTAGATNRHRFKDQPDDLTGALVQLGMIPHFTDPDKETGNPGSKPIERAFGIGGIHSAVATHPRFANRGFSRATAISIAELREVVQEEVDRLNAQTGRRTRVCGGVLSFNQAWEQSFAKSLPRLASEAQRRILLLMPEVVTVSRKDSAVAIQAGRGPDGQHRYWCEALAQFQGQKVVVYYDPDRLDAAASIYTLDGRFVAMADHLATVAFNDTQTGREWRKHKQRFLKANKEAAASETRMNHMERAALYPTTKPEPAPDRPARKVVAGHFGRVVDPQRDLKQAAGHDVVVDGDDRFAEAVERLRKAQSTRI